MYHPHPYIRLTLLFTIFYLVTFGCLQHAICQLKPTRAEHPLYTQSVQNTVDLKKIINRFKNLNLPLTKANQRNLEDNTCLKAFQNLYSGANNNTAVDVVATTDNLLYVASNSINTATGLTNILITKINLNGEVLWSKTYGSVGNETVRRVKLTTDGGLLITGQTTSFDNFRGDILCLKVSASGNLLWSQKFGLNSAYGDLGMDIIETSDKGYAVTGILNVFGQVADLIVMKLDNNRSITWAKRFNRGDGEDGSGIIEEGNNLIVTCDLENSTGDYDDLIMNLDKLTGKVVTAKKMDATARGMFVPRIYKDPVSGYWISGHMIDGHSYSNMEPVILKLDQNFAIQKTYELASDTYTNDYYTGFTVLKDGFLSCASPQGGAAGYLYYIRNDGSVKMAKKFKGAPSRSLYGVTDIGGKIISVGRDNAGSKNDILISGFGDDGFIDSECHPDTAIVGITNPSFNVTDFSWPTNTDISFSNTSAPLTTTDITLTPSSLCDACPVNNCSTWLNLQKQYGGVQVGDLDVTGNQLTVEGTFNRTEFYGLNEADVVSKHKDFNDVNYILRTNQVEITTTDGYFAAAADCKVELNKTYHVALVYNGSSLKFYRNGFLMKEVPATGTLITNNYSTTIGDLAWQPGYNNETLVGYINNVRIWKVARTQTQLNQYMNQPLPNPTTQNGLLASYTFDDLKNKQGNAAWDGTLIGNAVVNITNPTCPDFVADSCPVKTTEVTPSFTAPDTVCVNTPVKITNTTTGGSNFFWNFCTADINQPPIGDNLGNVGNLMNRAVYIDYVFENGKYYGFMTNNYPGKLMRLEFGTSLLNTPVVTDLGTVNNLIPTTNEGIQIVKNEGKWYLLIVGGDPNSVGSYIVKVELGTDIANNSPTGVNWGNIGSLSYPHDLYVFQDNNNWYGFAANTGNNTITRFSFSNSFSNTPTAVNLGNIGVLDGPTGLHAIKDNGNWHVFVTNALSSTLSRLDFGSSLLNTPTGVNLGNFGGLLHNAWDISVIKYCDNISGFIINADQQYNNLIRLNFSGDITSTLTATDLGNIGNMKFPHCLSKIFRAGADVYTFVANVENNSLTRLRFPGCTNSSVPNSSAVNPPDITYDKPGTYNINLSVDDGLPTQSSFCKTVVVLDASVTKSKDTIICRKSKAQLLVSGGSSYHWYPSAGLSDTAIANPTASPDTTITYYVKVKMAGGCEALDSIVVKVEGIDSVKIQENAISCSGFNFTGIASSTTSISNWQWDFGDQTTAITQNASHNFSAKGTFDIKLVVTDQHNCKDSIIKTINLQSLTPDFSFRQDLCNPLMVSFNGGAAAVSPYWDFGDGQEENGSSGPVHVYNSYGNYVIRYAEKNGLCGDTSTKTIAVNITRENVILTANTIICKGDSVQLNSVDALSYCWSPANTFASINMASPVVRPDTTTTYYLHTFSQGSNLIVNGDFALGNTGFTSEYHFITPNTVEGEYTVATNPNAWNGGMGNCAGRDNGSGNTNMMLVNGAPQSNVKVWSQDVKVTPNTTYAFSTWIQTISPLQNAAQLQFSINGKLLGNVFRSNNTMCIWEQFYEVWNSGTSTTATISIVNMNEETIGNDFALDDISFAALTLKSDSVTVRVVTPPVVNLGKDTSFCTGDSVRLNAANPGLQYLWQDNSITQTYLAKTAGWFYVKVTNEQGCSKQDSIHIDTLSSPRLFMADTTICTGNTVMLNANASGNNNYQWAASSSLSAVDIYNPVASPADTTVYSIIVTGDNGCKTKDSVTVAVVPPPSVTIKSVDPVCYGDSFNLTATATNATHYNWSPGMGLSDSTILNPATIALQDSSYTITVYNDGCSTTGNTRFTIKPLPVIMTGNDTAICAGGKAMLTASGGVGYLWTPSTTIDDVTSPQPTVVPESSTVYKVKVTGINGCNNYDSILVSVNPKPVFAISPKTAIVCMGDSVLLTASGGDVYAWSPSSSVQFPNIAASLVSPTENTQYTVTITNTACRVTNAVTANIAVLSKPEIHITKSNDIDCFIGSAKLEATGGSRFAWSPATALSSPYGSTTIARPLETTTYYVQVSKNGNCTSTDSIQVKVIKDGAPNGYYVPNAFTPNGDMRNDCFGVKNWGLVTNFEFSVYNRWGERVFYTRDPSGCWNGMYKNTMQPPGAFVYQIRAKTICGDVYRKGTVVLIR